MKSVTCTRILLAAMAAWLVVSTAFAAGPAGSTRYRDMRVAADPNAKSRVSSRHTSQVEPEQVAAPPAEGDMTYEGAPGMWDGYGGGDGFISEGGCSDGSCDIGCGSCRKGMWFLGADYLLVRPRLSEGTAAVTTTQTIVENGQTSVETLSDSSINYCFNYASSFRINAGYRLLDCGGDFTFTYWRLTGDASVGAGPGALINQQPSIRGQLDNNPGQGEFFNASTNITANIYDFDFGKTLCYGGPQNPCECNFCPRWDMRYFAGVRIGDITRENDNVVTDPNGDTVSTGDINARFTGAGPRIGAQGRRYFGQCGRWSVFAKGSQALLIGDYEMTRIRTELSSGSTSSDVASQYDSFCRMIPVTDIEVGGTWQVTDYCFVSAGWFFQCWWDLGQGEIIGDSNFGPLDSSNILSFDGLFVRSELLF
jgi:hypothetical protein